MARRNGSLQNLLAENSLQARAVPKVGDGITLVRWTDRQAGTIKRVDPKGRKFWFTQDITKRTDKLGMTDSGQVYSYEENMAPEDRWQIATLRRDGKWHEGTTIDGSTIMIGVRDQYRDPSF